MYKNIFKYDEMKRAEHMAVRETVGWYFWTHQILEVTGPDVLAFLEYMFPNDIATLEVGRNRYTTMLNEQGEIIDDVVVMRRSEDVYWVSTLFATKTDDFWYFHQGDFDVEWTEITDEWRMYAVQGPKSKELMETLAEESIADLLSSFPHLLRDHSNALDNAVRFLTQGLYFLYHKLFFDSIFLLEKCC